MSFSDMSEKQKKEAIKYFNTQRPKKNNKALAAIYDELNALVFNNELPKIMIGLKRTKEYCGGYHLWPDFMDASRNFILVSDDIPKKEWRNVICHEMVHFKTHLVDIANGVEFNSEKSVCPDPSMGGHDGMFETLGREIFEKFGIRVDQFYVQTLNSCLKNAGEQNYKDDGKEYNYIFYKVGPSIRCQKVEPNAKHIDKFPVFFGRIEELNDVPMSKGNPFDDKYFGDPKYMNVYTRPLDRYSREDFDFMELPAVFRSGKGEIITPLLNMRDIKKVI